MISFMTVTVVMPIDRLRIMTGALAIPSTSSMMNVQYSIWRPYDVKILKY
jgi:hypothetical protein